MNYEICYGDLETMKKIKEKGFRALNTKTHKFQIVDKNAKYEIRPNGIGFSLFSNKDLLKIAEEKGLIC